MKESLEQHLEKDRDEVRRRAAMIIRAHLLTFSAKYEPKKKAEFRFSCRVEKTRTKYRPLCYTFLSTGSTSDVCVRALSLSRNT